MAVRLASLALLFPWAGACALPTPPDPGTHKDGGGGVHKDGGGAPKDGAVPSGDMSVGKCPGKDLLTDPDNCGQCGHVCMLPNVAMNLCKAGQCAIGQCRPGYFDVDGKPETGCECQQDMNETTESGQCGGAVEAGTVQSGMSSMLTLTGNIVPTDDSDWYRIVSTNDPVPNGSCNKYNFKVSFADNPMSQFRFDAVYEDCVNHAACGGTGEQPDGITDYEWNAGGECPCVNGAPPPGQHKCANHSQILRLRVYRAMGAPFTCDNYKLTVTNGM